MMTDDWISQYNQTHRDKTKGTHMGVEQGPKKEPVTGTIEHRLNRNPDEVIQRAKEHVRRFDAEYDQGHAITIGFDDITDLIDVATELRKAAPDA